MVDRSSEYLQSLIQAFDILPTDPPSGRIKSRGFLAHFDELLPLNEAVGYSTIFVEQFDAERRAIIDSMNKD